ncbi:MAG: hypothetical protein MRQ12_05995, partial [Candidatus Midichloria mitochondrii]|nr:hypothetical protein [Candidatus Midichloria mitochondrii]
FGFGDISQEPREEDCQEIVWQVMPWCWICQISFNCPMAVSINPRPARSSCLKAASGFCFS